MTSPDDPSRSTNEIPGDTTNDPGRKPPLDREPPTPPRDVISAVQGRVLDPSTAITVEGVNPRPTVYVGPRLTISKSVDFQTALEVLRRVAAQLNWVVEPEPEDPRTEGLRFGVRAVTIRVGSGSAAVAPDGWTLLQQTRVQYGVDAVKGVGLDHVVTMETFGQSHPFGQSHTFGQSHGTSSPMSTYGVPGWGGRQPVAYVGPAPVRRPDAELKARRPVVAVLDTGCGLHPWLDDVVDTAVTLDGVAIGNIDPATAPDTHGDLVGELDGVIDPLSGHGTFICGLIHQTCPDADILAWRIVPSDGPIVESEWITALAQIAELVRRHRAGEKGGRAIDVLSLSIGYYHETPQDLLFDPTIYEILEDLSRHGTLVVCSAGNDATARPSFPAAFAPWDDGNGPVQADPTLPPIVSVGALNPSGSSDALFSNAGHWVRSYVPGAAVMSTMPAFEGGLQATARTEAYGRLRESIDPDNFRGGFAVWSGTSFAAPVMAGRLAAALLPRIGDGDDTATAVARAWDAVEVHTTITP